MSQSDGNGSEENEEADCRDIVILLLVGDMLGSVPLLAFCKVISSMDPDLLGCRPFPRASVLSEC